MARKVLVEDSLHQYKINLDYNLLLKHSNIVKSTLYKKNKVQEAYCLDVIKQYRTVM